MKYQLIQENKNNYNAIQTILTNRGIPLNEIHHYLNTTDADINDAEKLGVENLKNAARLLLNAINGQSKVIVIVDCDADGFTSSALLLNYLHDLFPSFVENNIEYYIHEGKEHGLSDCTEYILKKQFDLIILPDAGSNDYEYHKMLKDTGKDIIILDHHEAEKIGEYTCTINNQLSDYPNKDFSGVGIVWQFCRFLDKLMGNNFAEEYIDLVSLGNISDMMSLKSFETKHLITKGLKKIKNPFFYYMVDKNSYSIGENVTPMGVAFYVTPMINAIQRSGTFEEKDLVFKAMLNYKAFDIIPSNKRGHKPGDTEKVVEQAIRTATNVKNRQTRAQDACMDFLEKMIQEQDMMSHKVLLFLIEPGKIDKNIAGLCANKIMAKYQRPCCILTKVEEIDPTIILTSNPPQPYKRISYQGSARGYDKSGITNFKDICAETGCIMYAEGHQGAFGLGLMAEHIQEFIEKTDIAFENMSSEPIYLVDYIYKGVDVQAQDILDIAQLNDIWGKDMDEAFIAIEDLKVSKDMITLMSPDKKPTLKITLPNKISIIKFGSSQEEYESLQSDGYVQLDIIGKCNANNWMGNITPQVFIEDFEIIGKSKYNF